MNSPSAEHLGAQHLASAAQAFGAGDLDAARLSLLEAVKLEPNNPEIHNGLSAVAYRQGDIGEAVKHIKAAISNAPGHWGFWKQLIEMLMDRALHADAAAMARSRSAAGPLPTSAEKSESGRARSSAGWPA